MSGPYRDGSLFNSAKHTLIDNEGRALRSSTTDTAFATKSAAEKFRAARLKAVDMEDVGFVDGPTVGGRAREILQEEALVENDIWIKKQIEKINSKTQAGQELNNDDLLFIYRTEIYHPDDIQAVQKIRETRNVKEDAPVVLGCQPEEIAWDKDKINENSRIYVGPLFKELFSHFSNLETIYTSFPEGHVSFHSVKISGRSGDEIIDYYRSKGIIPSHSLELELHAKYGKEWQIRKIFTPVNDGREAEVQIVNLTVRDLGFSDRASLNEICKCAADLGLDAMTAQVALHYRLEYIDEAGGSKLLIPLKEHTNGPNLFALYAKVFNYPKIKCERQDPKVPEFGLNQKFSFELRPVELSEDDSLDGL